MPDYGPIYANPGSFSLPVWSPFWSPNANWQQVTFHVPALPSDACTWQTVEFWWTPSVWPWPGGFVGGDTAMSTETPFTSLARLFDQTGDPPSQGLGPLGPVAHPHMFVELNTNRLVARDVTFYFLHQGPALTATSLWMNLTYGVGCDPVDPGGGGGDGDDDDDEDNDGDSGELRAIRADSVRGWLHIAEDARIRTRHIVNGSQAFLSGSHGVSKWKQFRVDTREEGLFVGLGRAVGGGTSKVFISHDGGLSVEEVFSVECHSAVIEQLSEPKWLLLLKEATPPDVMDPLSVGAVTRYLSRDGLVTFESLGAVTLEGSALSARLLGMTYDERNGGEVILLCRIGSETKLLSSTDVGNTWEERLP